MVKLNHFHLQTFPCVFFEALIAIHCWESRSGGLAKRNCRFISTRKILHSGWLLLANLVLASAIGCGVTSPNQPRLGSPPPPATGATETCNEPGHVLPGGNPSNIANLAISGPCIVDGTGNAGGVAGSYVYGNVNILKGGSLTFSDAQIDFHAHSILVENGGTLQAGAMSPLQHQLTIWLWGGGSNDNIPSITCLSDTNNRCGVSEMDWNSNPNVSMQQMPTMPCTPATDLLLPNKDCFYQYDVLESGDITGAYFGKKVLAVSAGGSLILRGAKGMRQAPITTPIEANPADSGTSWARLTTTLKGGETSFTIDRAVQGNWAAGDHIVLTTTDYLPSHSEELVISNVTNNGNASTITVQGAVQYPHYGQPYDYSAVAAEHSNTGPVPDPNVTNLPAHNVETRAIVALLTRNIVIASEGANPTYQRGVDHFPAAAGSYYGGHTLARQGFTQFQVQGVEFYQLGQGGLVGHYPVHFHMDRSVPQPHGNFLGTYVADSSIVDSMTRFITVHATQGVTLARNVGYKSIGHGFYLEDATEINNKLYSNVGITVRGALANASTNPRMVPGILDLPATSSNNGIGLNNLPGVPLTPGGPALPAVSVGSQMPDLPPYTTDVTTPSVFWIMNTWNDFEYNAAVGAEACGACYWMVPGGYSYQVQGGKLLGGPSKYETWTDYAGMQKQNAMGASLGAAPLMTFTGNSCTAAMNSISTVGQTSPCNGILYGDGSEQSSTKAIYSIPNTNPKSMTWDEYPVESPGQRANATICDSAHKNDCSTEPPCTGQAGDEATCAATVIDHYTTSFNWAQENFAAIWLRGWWYLLQNSAITDIQNGGLTFISGGGYTRSDAAQGFWSVLKNSVMVGNTQPIDPNTKVPANPYASNAGPFNPMGLSCAYNSSHCISTADGISFQISNFGVNQRLFNIYDGPANQYNNIYSDVHTTMLGTLQDCRGSGGNAQPGSCANQSWMNGYAIGVTLSPRGNQLTHNCVLPNAAIAWKQPNGFYYPPAFNSDNLAFNSDPDHKVDIRHFVIQPLPDPNSPNGDNSAIENSYCTWNPGMFATSFTDIDRQTELTDNDGSLTGLTSNDTQANPLAGPTISVTKDPFFNAPLVSDQCASGQLDPAEPTSNGNGTASTSPYEYFTTAIVAQCAVTAACGSPGNGPASYWDTNCATPACYGVPLYRQTLTTTELNDFSRNGTRPAIKMMGQASAQRSTLTLNHAQYYIDTTVPATGVGGQYGSGPSTYPVQFINAFEPNQTYSVFFLFAKNSAQQTYSMYVGKNQNLDLSQVIVPARIAIPDNSFTATEFQGGSWIMNPTYDPTTGFLTLSIDLSQASDLQPHNQSGFCQPTSYCSWNSSTNTCGCAPNSGCTDNQVCSYATKDIDCPANGCYGFNLHMPSGFATAPNGQPISPPTPIAFPTSYFGSVSFVNATQSVAGACYYSTPPTPQAKTQSK